MTEVQQEKAVEQTPEQQEESLQKMATMRHKAFSQLVKIHIQNYGQTLIATKGVSYLEKRNALDSMLKAVEFALDFGLNLNNTSLRDKGTYAKMENDLASTLVHALDNRMILLAQKMKEEENNKTNETTDSQENQNG